MRHSTLIRMSLLLSLGCFACGDDVTTGDTITLNPGTMNPTTQEYQDSPQTILTCMYVRFFETPVYLRPDDRGRPIRRVNAGVYPILGLSPDGAFHRVIDPTPIHGDTYQVHYIKYWDLTKFELLTEWFFTYGERLQKPNLCSQGD